MADKFAMKDILELYESVTLDARFVRLSNLHDMPMAFGQPVFNTNYYDECFDMTDYLLKDLDFGTASWKDGENIKQDKPDLMGLEQEDKINIYSPLFHDAVQRLNACFTEENLASIRKIGETKFRDEACITAALGIHIIKKLSGWALSTEKIREMQCVCGCQPSTSEKLEIGNMYIGTENTWHGALDLISGTVALTTSLDIMADKAKGGGGDSSVDQTAEENVDENNSSCSSPRVNIYAETERHCTTAKNETIYQILSQAIVFGWTEYNQHREFSPFIPSIFIDNQKFVVVVYNPAADSLMVSKICCFEKDNKEINHAAIFLLWLVLNYRMFFRKHTVQYERPCGFKSQMETRPYEELYVFQSCIRANLPCIQLEVSRSNLRVRIKRKRSLTE